MQDFVVREPESRFVSPLGPFQPVPGRTDPSPIRRSEAVRGTAVTHEIGASRPAGVAHPLGHAVRVVSGFRVFHVEHSASLLGGTLPPEPSSRPGLPTLATQKGAKLGPILRAFGVPSVARFRPTRPPTAPSPARSSTTVGPDLGNVPSW